MYIVREEGGKMVKFDVKFRNFESMTKKVIFWAKSHMELAKFFLIV